MSISSETCPVCGQADNCGDCDHRGTPYFDEATVARMVETEKVNREGIPDSYDGPIWETHEMQADFVVMGFAAPMVVVKRKSDGVKGTLYFTHSPRRYFDFQEHVS